MQEKYASQGFSIMATLKNGFALSRVEERLAQKRGRRKEEETRDRCVFALDTTRCCERIEALPRLPNPPRIGRGVTYDHHLFRCARQTVDRRRRSIADRRDSA